MSELIRIRVLRPGDVVTVHPCAGAYTELPPGLASGSLVTVLEVDRGYATAEDSAGQRFTVAFPQIIMPRDVWWHGQWIDCTFHPDGKRAYEWALNAFEDYPR